MSQSQSETSQRDSDQIVAQLKAWIISNNENAEGMDADTDIVENKLVDSLNFINFLVLVEELRGEEIPYDEVEVERFRTLRSIKTHFLDAR